MNAHDVDTLLGSLLVVGVRGASIDDSTLRADLEACAAAHIGGVILFDSDARTGAPRNIVGPGQVQRLCCEVRAALGERALLFVDQEGGAVARLRADLGFVESPSARAVATLPASARRSAVIALAEQVRAAGFDCNLAPCVDVALRAESAVVVRSGRCFSDDAGLVAALAGEVIEAHRAAGVLSCVKHFPGHGCAREDSHETLPEITDSFDAPRDLAPYRALLSGDRRRRPDMVMTAHLLDRSVDAERPASLSRAHTTGVLRDALRWDGVVITDSIDMGAIASQWSAEEAAALALSAGADLVMHAFNPAGADEPHPAPALACALRQSLEKGRIAGGVDRLSASADRVERLRAACPASRASD